MTHLYAFVRATHDSSVGEPLRPHQNVLIFLVCRHWQRKAPMTRRLITRSIRLLQSCTTRQRISKHCPSETPQQGALSSCPPMCRLLMSQAGVAHPAALPNVVVGVAYRQLVSWRAYYDLCNDDYKVAVLDAPLEPTCSNRRVYHDWKDHEDMAVPKLESTWEWSRGGVGRSPNKMGSTWNFICKWNPTIMDCSPLSVNFVFAARLCAWHILP